MKKSFSLIELIIAVSIFMVLAIVVIASFTTIMGTKSKVSTGTKVQQEAQKALEMIANDIELSNTASHVYNGTEWKCYYGFVIIGAGGVPVTNNGTSVKITYRDAGGNKISKLYFLQQTSNPGENPTSRLMVGYSINNEAALTINARPLTSREVYVQSLSFSGSYILGPHADPCPPLTPAIQTAQSSLETAIKIKTATTNAGETNTKTDYAPQAFVKFIASKNYNYINDY